MSPTVRRSWDWLWIGALALLGFVVRLLPVLLNGGLGFMGRYDDGVYYSAADALSYGRLPYTHFVLLHPPGITLVLLPFAWLGRATSDLTGFEVARLGFMAIGAINTALVASIARRWGRTAMVIAALMYACWQPAVYAEQSTFLEPVGGLLVLIALHRLVNTERPRRSADLAAGCCLGAAVTIKIWYVAPWAAVVLWLLFSRRPKGAARLMVAGVATVAAIVVPFVVLTGSRMDQMVLRDQLFRRSPGASRVDRVGSLVGVRSFIEGHAQLSLVLTIVLVWFFVIVTASALWDRAARPLAVVLVVNTVVLMLSPVFLRHYASFIAAPATLLVGIAVQRLASSMRWRVTAPVVVAALVALFGASMVGVALTDGGHRFPAAEFAAAAPAGCIAADDPQALVEIDRLSSDLRAGCRVAIDVSGPLLDEFNLIYPDGQLVPKRYNPGWQRYLYDYLTRAQAFIVSRAPSDGIVGQIANYYAQFPLVAQGPDARDTMRLGSPQ